MDGEGWRFRSFRGARWIGADEVDSYLTAGEPWADRVRALLPDARHGLDRALVLLDQLSGGSAAHPTARWRTETQRQVGSSPELLELARGMVESFAEVQATGPSPFRSADGDLVVPEWRFELEMSGSEMLIQGAVWAIGVAAPPWGPELLVRIPGCARGVAAERGNFLSLAGAAIRALGWTGAVDELIVLESRLTHRGLLTTVGKALETASARSGRRVEAVRESSVDAHELDAGGTRRIEIGDCSAVLQVEPTRVRVTWSHGGKERQTVPKHLRTDHAGEVEEVKRTAARLRKALAAESTRLERLMVSGSGRALADWVRDYGEHPLTGVLTRRLVWRVDGRWARSTETPGEFVTLHGPLRPAAGATVELVHPVDGSGSEVADWQRFLLDHEWVQPFPQMFRECYRPEPGDLDPAGSRRFAGRVLHYGQFDALLRGRGWTLPYRGSWDRGESDFEAERIGPGLRAGLRVEELNIERQTLRFVRTGPVVFSVVGPDRPPDAVAFSEACRDLDLVTTTADIARTGTLVAEGDVVIDRAFAEQAFAELTTAGRARRDVLGFVLPLTDLADRCRIDGNLLRVRGRDGDFRIHLGTGQTARDDEDGLLPGLTLPADPKLFLPTDDPLLRLILRSAQALITPSLGK